MKSALLSSLALICVAVSGSVRIRAAASFPPPPPAELPAGLELILVAAPPIVNHPIMGCIDDRGRLFVGDAGGVNLDRKGLEEQLPNRVLMLEDTNGDGIYDKSTVYADRMTFPQGGCWLDGSLYVASPPGIWKFTDTTGDGVADQREMIVGGFDYTGNAADVHGPFLHPNGRLFWCHGRKGHKVVQKDGTLVHEGLASGIWSCEPDGSDVQWHSLGSMDNPVEVDFTPEGEIVGVVNLYYNQPRGDTLVHWLYGGVYERSDQMKAIAQLPRTLEKMPVIHNFGHVAVSGFTRYRSGAINPAWKDNLFVTFFNTQKVVRVGLTAAGATYRATEHEFLKINDSDAHITDVIEEGDGSLLVLDTGGWFRRGCPSSLVGKPDVRGAIYRIRRKDAAPVEDPYGMKIDWAALDRTGAENLRTDERWTVRERAERILARKSNPAAAPEASALLDASRPMARLRACESIAQSKRLNPVQRAALLKMLEEPLEPTLEHAALYAAIATNGFDPSTLREARAPALIRRLLVIIAATAKEPWEQDIVLEVAQKHIDAADLELAQTAVKIAARHPRALELCHEDLKSRLAGKQVSRGTLDVISSIAAAHLTKPEAQKLITAMLQHRSPALRQTAWRILSSQSGAVTSLEWIPPLEASLARAAGGAGGADLLLVLGAIGKLRTNHFDAALRGIMTDASKPQPIRLKALAALSRPNEPLSADAFALLMEMSRSGTSPTARVDAARFLSRARLSKAQLLATAPLLASAGPVELMELLKIARKTDEATARIWAEHLARSAVFDAIEESAVRLAFSLVPPEIYETILGPSVRAAAAANDARKRKLEELTAAAERGRPHYGKGVYEASSCAACHKVGDIGRTMGPDLTHIGQIRTPRDLLEAILFPSATIARDFETHVIETGEGQSLTGTIKSDAPDGLVLIDLAGQEMTIPHAQIVGRSVLATSLMPMGLEQAFTEQQLLDMIAWLASLK